MSKFKFHASASLALAVSFLHAAQPAYAANDRAEEISDVRVFALPECPIMDDGKIDGERIGTSEFLGPIFAAFLSAFAGDLVKSGINAAGDALEQASKEKAIGVEGTTSFPLSRVVLAEDKAPLATIRSKSQCVVMASADTDQDFIGILNNPVTSQKISGTKFSTDNAYQNAQLSLLSKNGVNRLPKFYAEIRILQFEEGLVLRPMTVLYLSPFKGAPAKGPAAAELHMTLATPALATDTSAIGTPFAVARIQLPKIAPGQMMTPDELYSSRSVVLPLRPATGFVADRLAAINTSYATLGTKKLELKVATRAREVAKRKLDAKPNDADLAEAFKVATETEADANLALEDAKANVANLAISNDQVLKGIGATNLKARFVVIRQPNAFGLALAKALKGTADGTSKAVSDGIGEALKSKPAKPEWAAGDTAYLTALTELQAKERAYSAAVEKGDGSVIASAAAEVLLAKAKLNEAAVAINRPIPYPQLF